VRISRHQPEKRNKEKKDGKTQVQSAVGYRVSNKKDGGLALWQKSGRTITTVPEKRGCRAQE